MIIGNYVKHPDHKNYVQITEIDGDMVCFIVMAPKGGQFRMWANVATFTEHSWI